MTNSARRSGRPSSSAAYNVGDVVDTPDSAIKSWRYLGAGEWEPNDAVRYTTGPGGGIEFPGLSPLTAAVRNAVQYIVSHADLEARPPRLWPVDAVPYRLFCAWSGGAWGTDNNALNLIRVDGTTHAAQTTYTFGPDDIILKTFAGHHSLLVLTYTAAGLHTLWRTEDGATVEKVHEMGKDATQHWPWIQLMQGGLRAGKINGQEALLFATYNIQDNYGGSGEGTQNDQIYIGYSMDDGRTWTRLNTWTWDYATGTGTRHIRHFHAVHYDQWRDCWWIAAGDTDTQAALIRWDGRTMGAIGNVSPTQMQTGAYPGWMCRTGAQRWRSVDIIVTEDWIETYTDSETTSFGGNWRVRPDFSGDHRVGHPNIGEGQEGWYGLIATNGVRYWCTNVANSATTEEQYCGIYASRNGNRIYEIGRVAVKAPFSMPYSFFELNDKLWFATTQSAGKTSWPIETTIYEQRGTFREERPDNLGPCYFVNFASGNDANSGFGAASAWKTMRNALTGSRVTYGARIMLSAGSSTENGLTDIDYHSHATPSTYAQRPVQISGQGRDLTTVVIGGATDGIKGDAAKLWSVEFTDMALTTAAVNKKILCDNAADQAGSGFTLRDAAIGTDALQSYSVTATSTRMKLIRTLCRNQPYAPAYAALADGTGVVEMHACIVRGGQIRQANGGRLEILHCDILGQRVTSGSVSIESTATVAPKIVNTIIQPRLYKPIVEASTSLTLTTADIYGCVYSTPADANIPASIIPAGTVLDKPMDTHIPYQWSEICGLAQPAGVSWDYYGNPFRARPAIGAVEIPPTF